MTKFILVGGYPYKADDGGKAMCTEMVAGFIEPVRVLICLFARNLEEWPEQLEKNKDFFERNLPGVKLEFVLADEVSFVEQLKGADVLYLAGGDTTELKKRLEKVPEWIKHLSGKTVMGSSAGAEILARYAYDVELFKCTNCLGLAPVKIIVHFESEKYAPPVGWKAALEELKNYKEDLPIAALREGEYKVFEV